MSRLHEILENHDNMEQFISIVKHYGVNAEFLAQALISHLEDNRQEQSGGAKDDKKKEKNEQAGKNEDTEADQTDKENLLEDLKQFIAKF